MKPFADLAKAKAACPMPPVRGQDLKPGSWPRKWFFRLMPPVRGQDLKPRRRTISHAPRAMPPVRGQDLKRLDPDRG